MSSINKFRALPTEVKRAILKRCRTRVHTFLSIKQTLLSDMEGFSKLTDGKILLIGDRPAPSAPTDPQFHFTPFAALNNSSLWLNLQLHEAGVVEENLCWINSADLAGVPTDPSILLGKFSSIICLGNNAQKWLVRKDANLPHYKVHHPAAWKRFNCSKPYPLLDLLTCANP